MVPRRDNKKSLWPRRLALVGIAIAGLFVVLVVAGYVRAAGLLARDYSAVEPVELDIDHSSASVERGRYLATAVLGCSACHGADMAGALFLDSPGVARVTGTNLTQSTLDERQMLGAIRHGVGADGRPLRFMGGGPIGLIAGEDLAALVAYLQQLEPIERELPETRLRPLGALAVLAGTLDLTHAQRMNHEAPVPPRPELGESLEYGRYLAEIAGCIDCHRENLAGGPYPGTPPWFPEASNLTASGMGDDWDYADFVAAMSQGRALDGHTLHPLMPWTTYMHMREADLRTLWMFVSSAEPSEVQLPMDAYRTYEAPGGTNDP